MKALSIRQPWAWLISEGIKDVENRSWYTSYRGKILIHAGRTIDYEAYDWVKDRFSIDIPLPENLYKGGIIAEVEILDCLSFVHNDWFTGPYGLILRNPRKIPFIPWKGKLKLFYVEI